MNPRPILVAGLDPGTTQAIALLDTDGRIALLESSKQFTFSDLLEKTVAAGRVAVVGCDRKAVPDLVSRYAAKFGCRIIAPDHDLLVEEKKQLVKSSGPRNSHEVDALASARFASMQVSPLVRKVRIFCKRERKEGLFADLLMLVVKQGLGIRLAADILERPEQEDVALVRKVIAEESIPRHRVLRLYERLARERDNNRNLRRENQRLQEKLVRRESLTEYLQKKLDRLVSDEKAEQLLNLRQELIVGLTSKVRALAHAAEELKKELDRERLLISRLHDGVLVKKVRNLGSQEFEKKREMLDIQRGDILLVEDAGVVSESIVRQLAQWQTPVLVKGKISQKIAGQLSIVVGNAADLITEETRHFAALDRSGWERQKASQSVLKRIVKDYQQARK